MKKKILYVSGTRADYGLMRQVLLKIKKSPVLEVEIIATGMHLMPEFGRTLAEIEKDEFKVHKINVTYENDQKEASINFIGNFILSLSAELKKIKPDILFILGDRAEALAGAVAGVYLQIPVVHSHGGDVSSGLTTDGIARHAITKLSHIHFAASRGSAERIIKMGEEKWRVFITGAPGLDEILSQKLFSKEKIAKDYKLDISKPIFLVLQNPVALEDIKASKQMEETMEAIRELGHQTIVVYPNADTGGREMIKVIKKYRKYPFINIYQNIPHSDYLSILNVVSVMVGNSTSGIIEAPSFNLPVVNIGLRQQGRERTKNIIDVGYDRKEIKKAILHSLKVKNKKYQNPYGEGQAGEKIVKILENLEINQKLLNKKISY